MGGSTVIFMVLSGLCILPSCFPHLYHIIKDKKTWTEAQTYCREKYTDLVTINSEEDMVRLSYMLWDDEDEFWIGLYSDINNWKWSLQREGFYRERQAEFRNWNGGEPSDFTHSFVCGDISPSAGWSDFRCDGLRPFVCYNELSEPKYIYVRTYMNWTDAQRYCREHHTDLASVRNIAENEEIRRLVEFFAWTGLHREAWKWSDGQSLHMTSYTSWNESQPDKILQSCVTTTHSRWNARHCNTKYPFVCSEVTVMKQVVKVMLTRSDSSVDLEEIQDAILQQLNQRLKDHSLGDNVKLSWIKQANGKIFNLKGAKKEKEKEEEDKEETSCILRI